MDWPKQIIPKTLVPDAILNPPLKWYGTSSAREPLEDQFKEYRYPVDGLPEAHMVWSDSPSWITCWNNGFKLDVAFRSPKIEFVLLQHPWMENDCLCADIILPSNTKFEQELDIAADTASGQFHTVLLEEKCIEPLGESKTDYEIVCLIADKLGLLEEFTIGRSCGDWVRLGFDTSGIANRISYEELREKKYYVVTADPNWKKYKVGIKDYCDHPEKHPLKTPSGKIEFYSQNLAKHFPDDKERPPVPHWVEKSDYHDERRSSERAKKYPLLCMSNHPRWRVHAQLDDVTWFHEIPTSKIRGPDAYLYEPIWINPSDAAKRGMKNGDVVKVFNERGGVLCGAYIEERIMPGVVGVEHGARYDPIVVGELDRGGAINTITPHNITSKNCAGMVTNGFLVEVELANLDELRKKSPEAFNRPYDQAAGLCLERVLSRGKKK